MRVLFTCGGTAGHINPAIAVAGRIRELMPDSEILFVGAEGNMETELVPREGFKIVTVKITNIQRAVNLDAIKHNIGTVRNVIGSRSAAKRIIKDFQPDIAVGTGGYVCYPVLSAASSLGVPTAVHESNAVPGLTTKMLERVVDRIMVGFEESRQNYKKPQLVEVTGTPVRSGFMNIDKQRAREKLGLPADTPLIVSVWGSLGATHMNEIITGLIETAAANPFFTLIHSTGKRDYQKMCGELTAKGIKDPKSQGFDIREYIYDMPLVMQAADLVMCRSGASTLSELCALGKPAILVPSPNVTNAHQEKNARVFEQAGAAKVLIEGEFTHNSLLGTVSELLNNPKRLEEMAGNMKSMSKSDASNRIVDIMLDLRNK